MSTVQPLGRFGNTSIPQPDWLTYLQQWKPNGLSQSFVLPRPHPLTLLLARLKARAQAQEDLRHEEFMAGD